MGHEPSYINVSGEGSIAAPAHSFALSIKVIAKSETPKEAMSDAGWRQRAVLSAIGEVLDPSEVVAHGAAVEERRYYVRDEEDLMLYEATATIHVHSMKVGVIPEVTRLALESGADELTKPRFYPEDAAKDELAALAAAAQSARKRAEAVANALGVRLVRIASVHDEHNFGFRFNNEDPSYMVCHSMAAESLLTETPEVVEGTMVTSATVKVTWEIE